MKQDNKGFTLIELIIIMGISAILLTIGVRNLGVLDSYRGRECKDKIVRSLQQTRMDCLSKSKENISGAICGPAISGVQQADTYLEIEYSNRRVYVIGHRPGAKVGDPAVVDPPTCVSKGNKTRIEVRYVDCDDGTESRSELSDGQSISIGFNRSTGELLPVDNQNVKILSIYVITGNNEREITISPNIGKVN